MPPVESAVSTNDVAERCPLSAQAGDMVPNHPAPDAFVDALAREGLHRDAFTFLAHWLSKRDAIWWGCLCLWHPIRSAPGGNEGALRTLLEWVQDPSEKHRRALERLADANADKPVAFLAQAAFVSSGSLSAPGLPDVFAPRSLHADIVAKTVLLAATSGDERTMQKNNDVFVMLGREVAAGRMRPEGA